MESAVVVAAVPPPATPTYLYSRESASRSDMLSRVSRGSTRVSRISRGLVTVTGASCWGLQELSAVCCCCSKQKVCEVRWRSGGRGGAAQHCGTHGPRTHTELSRVRNISQSGENIFLSALSITHILERQLGHLAGKIMNNAVFAPQYNSPLHFPASVLCLWCGAGLGGWWPGTAWCQLRPGRGECRKTECGSVRLGSQSATSRQPRHSRHGAAAASPRAAETRAMRGCGGAGSSAAWRSGAEPRPHGAGRKVRGGQHRPPPHWPHPAPAQHQPLPERGDKAHCEF